MTIVGYDRQTIDSPNPLARFAHRTRLKRALSIVSHYLPANGSVVDFGAGPATFLSALEAKRPNTKLLAIEPHMDSSDNKRIVYLQSLAELVDPVDVVTAFEVCEHLSDIELDEFLVGARRNLKVTGRLIISVPIMIGVAVTFKEANRALLFGRSSEYTLGELLRATFGFKVNRPFDRRPTHKGFDFRELLSRIDKDFSIEKVSCSPFPLPWWLNSQVFVTCRQKNLER